MSTKGSIARLEGAYNTYNDLLKTQYTNAQTGYQPYTTSGTNALAKLQDPATSFQASPGYDYRLKQGLGAVTQTKAAQGLLRSGSYGDSLLKTGQDYGSNEFGNWWNQQSGLASMGMGAQNALTGVGMNYANTVGQNGVNLQQGITGLKQQNQQQINSLAGGVAGMVGNLATGGGLGGTGGGLQGLWGSIGGGGGMGGMASTAQTGMAGYNFGMA